MITLYHAGYQTIEAPDVHFGRKNADFGQGFYTTDDLDFACSWVREKSGSDIVINRYELDEGTLKIKRLDRNKEWFEYIFANRRSMPDSMADYDVIIGPIANDTIYETFGIITSGYMTDDEAMKLLMVGDYSMQIVLKTEVAAKHLRFVASETLSKEQIDISRKKYIEDDAKFQAEFARAMEEI